MAYYLDDDNPDVASAEYHEIVEQPVYCKRCQALYEYNTTLQETKAREDDPDIPFGTVEFRKWME